jgi:hypothetical protein
MTKQEVLAAANVMIAYANGKKVGTRPRRSMEPLLKILYVPTWNWEQKDYCMIPDDATKESLEQSQGVKAVSDTPRMKAAQMAAMEHMTGDVYRVGCDLEIEVNAANAIIRQQQLLDEENLRLQDRIKRLEEAFEASEELIRTFGCGCPYGDEVYRCSRCVAAMNKYDAAKKAKEAKS